MAFIWPRYPGRTLNCDLPLASLGADPCSPFGSSSGRRFNILYNRNMTLQVGDKSRYQPVLCCPLVVARRPAQKGRFNIEFCMTLRSGSCSIKSVLNSQFKHHINTITGNTARAFHSVRRQKHNVTASEVSLFTSWRCRSLRLVRWENPPESVML